MFDWINKQGVKSNEGYVVQQIHRFYFYYIEGERVLKVFVEPIKNGIEIILEPRPKWEPPSSADQITEAKSVEIENRILDALKFMGIKYTIKRK